MKISSLSCALQLRHDNEKKIECDNTVLMMVYSHLHSGYNEYRKHARSFAHKRLEN